MAPQSDHRPSGSSLPGTRADGSASAVEEAAAWLERRGRPRSRHDERRREDAPYAEGPPPDTAPDSARDMPPDAQGASPDEPPDDPVLLGPDADAEEVARKILLDQLTGQARSRSELAAKLAKRRVPDEVAERLLNRFEEVGLVDDAAFARAWVESRQPGKGLGRRALARELRRKLRTMRGVDRVTATRRLAGMLARKGHGGDVVWRVIREELDALAVPEDAGDLGDTTDLP